MQFGQLIEHKMRNIFLGKSSKNMVEKVVPLPDAKKSKLSISLDQQSKML